MAGPKPQRPEGRSTALHRLLRTLSHTRGSKKSKSVESDLENERASHVLGDVIQHLRVAAHQAQQPEVSGAGILLCSVGEGVHHVNDNGWRVGMAVCRVGLRGDSYSLPLCNTAERVSCEALTAKIDSINKSARAPRPQAMIQGISTHQARHCKDDRGNRQQYKNRKLLCGTHM